MRLSRSTWGIRSAGGLILLGLLLAPLQAYAGALVSGIDPDLATSDWPRAVPLAGFYLLTVDVQGSGSVAKNPDLMSYSSGTHVTLTATPASGWHFVGWSGDATGSDNPLGVTMDADKAVTATFAINTYTLTVTTVGNGIVSPTPAQARYDYGTVVQLTAIPATGWHLAGWSGDATGSANPILVTMGANRAITATFAINTYTLSVTTVGNGGVTSSPDQPNYDYGTGVLLTATPATGWHFVGWSGDASGSANPFGVTMDADKSVTATFAVDSYTLTVTTLGSGSVSRSPDQTAYDPGAVVRLTATPATGWHLVVWTGDASGTSNPLDVTMDANRVIGATFAINSYTLTVTTVGSGSVSRSPDQPTYDHGTVVQLTALPAMGWHSMGWSGDATGFANPLSVTMDRPKTITATFVINNFLLTVTSVGPGHVTKQPDLPSYPPGSIVQLTAVPDPGNHLSTWFGGGATGTTNPLSVTMDASKSIIAFFKPTDANFELPDDFVSQLVVGGLSDPTGMAFLPDGRVLVVEKQTSQIRMVVEGTLGAVDPLCVVDSVASEEQERGLLGVTVDPGWPLRPYVYVYYTAIGGTIRLSRYTATGELSDGSSANLRIGEYTRYDVLRNVPDLQEYHNAGTLRFGPDGMLYVSIGDDANSCAAQDTSSLKGVLLRLDVSHLPDGGGGPPDRALLVPPGNPYATSSNVNRRLVWAMGLRNPFRFHIDPATGVVFVADVGFNDYEEVDRVATAGRDFGWPYFEGPESFPGACGTPPPVQGLEPPIYSYWRTGVTSAVIGAGVYRGSGCVSCDFPSEYTGDYFFADFYQGFLRRLKFSGGTWALAPPVLGQPNATDWARGFGEISDFLTGPDGALWYCRMSSEYQPETGEIGRIFYRWNLTDVGQGPATGLAFAPPYPSPARDLVHFVYTLPASATIELSVFDVSGRLIRPLIQATTQSAGRHHLAWDGHGSSGVSVPPGVYLARLLADGRPTTRRVVFAR